MKKVTLEITSCKQCPFLKVGSSYSLDGWDRGEDWTCEKEKKIISSFVEWNDKPKIPDWCPLQEK